MSTARWRRWQDWSLGAKSAAAVVIPFALLLLGLVFSYRLQQGSTAADADVRRALVIKSEIQALHSLIAEAATSVRGYLLTGRDEFLTPYRAALGELPVTLTTLRRNIRDPEMKTRLEHIQNLLQQKLDDLQALVERGRSLPADELQAQLVSSKAVLDELRAEIRAMDAREASLLAEYSAQARQALLDNLRLDALITLLLLASGLSAFLLLTNGVVRRVQKLAINAERLTRDQALEALPAGRDEIGVLAERLQNASLLLASRAAAANAASEAKTQFLSRTSHELRTPLNAILGFAQLLRMDTHDPRQSAQIEHILSAGRHLLTLIDEVLDIARIESGELTLQRTAQALLPLVTEARDLIAPLSAQQQVQIDLAPELAGLAAAADRQRLRQVLLNLLSNAVKYNRPGGSVQVTAHRDGDVVYLSVQDTGIGIAAAKLARLFTPFDRLDAEQGAVTGTGLGLAVSRQLMRCMEGDITVASTPGVGSRFTLRLAAAVLPKAQAHAASPAQANQATESATHQRCVLVIEDNPSNLALVQAVVARRAGWRLVAAPDGSEGLRRSRECQPDLILLDLHLPGDSGEQVLAQLRAAPGTAATPIVIISAEAMPATIERLLAQGASDYLAKPLSVPRLLALLDQPSP